MLESIETIQIGPEGRWVRVNGDRTVALSHRPRLCMVLEQLWERRVSQPGRAVSVTELAAQVWPGEELTPSQAANRVYVAIATLRSYGLRRIVQSWTGGYRIDPLFAIQPSVSDIRELAPVAESMVG